MCCFFNYCNRNIPQQRVIIGPQGPRGPIGPQGPIGPMGPQGVSSTNDAIYAGTNGATVASGVIIPIAQLNATPASTITVANNAVNIPSPGTYLINYFVNGSVPTGDLAVSLFNNGVAIPNETITLGNEDTAVSSSSKTILLTLTGPATLSLYNSSAGTATLSGATITAVKLA